MGRYAPSRCASGARRGTARLGPSSRDRQSTDFAARRDATSRSTGAARLLQPSSQQCASRVPARLHECLVRERQSGVEAATPTPMDTRRDKSPGDPESGDARPPDGLPLGASSGTSQRYFGSALNERRWRLRYMTGTDRNRVCRHGPARRLSLDETSDHPRLALAVRSAASRPDAFRSPLPGAHP